MTSALEIILPIFALILAGFFYRRTNRLGAAAASELNRFVVYLALPALLFDIMSKATWSELYLPGFVATFSLGCGVIYALTVIIRLRVSHNLADASIDGLGAAYANTGYIGFPLCLLLFGKESLPAVTVAAIVTTCVLFAVAIVLIEIGLHAEQRIDRLIVNVGVALACNPLLVSPVLGILVRGVRPWHAARHSDLPYPARFCRESKCAHCSWCLPRREAPQRRERLPNDHPAGRLESCSCSRL
ncbi:MAG: AEC family transporter [Hyphomicrobium sp.]